MRFLAVVGLVVTAFLAVQGPTVPPAVQQPAATGQEIFRNETFGNEKFWTDTARMNEVVQSSVSPSTALKVGLKVDAEAIPPSVAQAIKAGKVDLNSPAKTVTLLKLIADVGMGGNGRRVTR